MVCHTPALPHDMRPVHTRFRYLSPQRAAKEPSLLSYTKSRLERSGSAVECLTRDRGVTGSSLTGVTALCP